MKIHPSPYHWILGAAIFAALMLTFSDAHGRSAFVAAAGIDVGMANARVASRQDVKPARDKGVAKDQRSASKKVKRAAKRSIDRSRHGVSPIDAGSKAGAR